MSTNSFGWKLVLGAWALSLAACPPPSSHPGGDEPDAGEPDGGLGCAVPSGSLLKLALTGADQLDLLFVIDNSQSMREEQEKLKVQLPRLVKILTTGDLDQDGDAEFQPVRSLHLGVISSNMGTLGQLDDTVQ